jgi:hypothetical protein
MATLVSLVMGGTTNLLDKPNVAVERDGITHGPIADALGRPRYAITTAVIVRGNPTERETTLGTIQGQMTAAMHAQLPWGTDERGELQIEDGDVTVAWDIVSATITRGPSRPNADFIRATLSFVCLPLGRAAALDVPVNQLAYPIAYDNAAWTKTAATVTANATAAPDGTTTADKLVDTTNNSTHQIRQDVATDAGATVYLEVPVKAAEYSRINLRLRDASNNMLANYSFNLTTQQITTGTDSGIAPDIDDAGNGWYLCRIAAVNPSATTQVLILLVNNSALTTFPGDADPARKGVYLGESYLGYLDPAADTTGVTITNGSMPLTGTGLWQTIEGVPGTVPALVEMTVDDASSGVIVEGIRIARHAALDLSAFSPILDAAAGADTASSPTTGSPLGGTYHRTESSTSWKEAATFTVPFRSLGDFRLICRDSVAATTPIDITSVLPGGSGSLPDGAYQLMVAGYNSFGDLIVVSTIESASIGNLGGAGKFDLTWETVSSANSWRLYWKRGIEAWKYKGTSSSSASYSFTTESGATTATPPSEADVTTPPTLVRAKIKVGSRIVRTTDAITAQIGANTWEALRLLVAEQFPPQPRREYQSDLTTTISIEIKSSATNQQNFDIDGAFVMAEGQAASSLLVTASGLSSNRRWILDSARDGGASGELRNLSTDALVGLATALRQLTVEPSPLSNHLTWLPNVAGGAFSTSASLRLKRLRVTPRYRSIGGVG